MTTPSHDQPNNENSRAAVPTSLGISSSDRLLSLALDIQPLPLLERLQAFRNLAAQSLTDALIVSQRVAAVRFIHESPLNTLTEELRFRAEREFLITQAISHIAPSYTGNSPAVTINEDRTGHVLRGKIPWVTGIEMAEYIATGATDHRGMHYIALLPRHHPSLSVSVSSNLLALQASETGSILLSPLTIRPEQLLLGPEEKLITHRGGKLAVGYPPLSTSMLALGHAQRCLQTLEKAACKVPQFEPIAAQLADQIYTVQRAVELQAKTNTPPQSHEPYEELRARANCIALQAANLAATAAGGQGFLQGTLASQLTTESQFFLVWALSPRAKVRTMELLAQNTALETAR